MHFARFACASTLAALSLVACDSGNDSNSDDDGGDAGSQAGTTSGRGGASAAGNGGTGVTAGTAGTPAAGTANGAGGSGTSGSGSGGAGAGTSGSSGASGTGSAGAGSGGAGAGSGASAGSGAGGSTAGAGASGGSAGTSGGDPCATALFCDDFEAYTTGQPPLGKWSQRSNGGSVSVDETRHVSGTKAVKVTTMASGSTKTAFIRIFDASVFPVPNNTFYGRMLFYLEAAPTASVHWTFIQSSGLIEGQSYRAQYRYGGQQPVGDGNQLMANYETPDSYSGNGPSSDCWNHANGKTVPVGTWACAEWKFDGPNNEMRFWLDGVAQDDLTVSGTGQGCVSQGADYVWTAPQFSELELGWESYQNDTERTLYIDDVVISTTQVGCPE